MNDLKEASKEVNELLLDVCKSQRETIKFMRNSIIAVVCSFTIIICTMIIGFFWYESQFEVIETTTTTTTTDMEASGENATINNVTDGNMYNDNAIHNETEEGDD